MYSSIFRVFSSNRERAVINGKTPPGSPESRCRSPRSLSIPIYHRARRNVSRDTQGRPDRKGGRAAEGRNRDAPARRRPRARSIVTRARAILPLSPASTAALKSPDETPSNPGRNCVRHDGRTKSPRASIAVNDDGDVFAFWTRRRRWAAFSSSRLRAPGEQEG